MTDTDDLGGAGIGNAMANATGIPPIEMRCKTCGQPPPEQQRHTEAELRADLVDARARIAELEEQLAQVRAYWDKPVQSRIAELEAEKDVISEWLRTRRGRL